MDRKQFTFYESFAKAIRNIRKPSDRCAAYDALVNYALYGEEPDLNKAADSVALFFEMAKPNLDSSKKKAENGKRGGMAEAKGKREESASKPQAKPKQTASEKENEKEDEKEREKEKEVENECSIPCPPPPSQKRFTQERREEMILEALGQHGEQLRQAVRAWTKYKIEKRDGYQETGYRNLLSQIRKNAEQYGDDAVADIISVSMSSNYAGIVFDRLDRPAKHMSKTEQYVASMRNENHRHTADEMEKLLAAVDRI